jgi:large subunit ribosomal protein L13e
LSAKRKRKVDRDTTPKAKELWPRPAGKAPQAMVSARHGTGVVIREGRGFSVGELSDAGLSPQLASRWGLKLDYRRRTVIRGNVDSLRSWGSHATLGKKGQRRTKKVEEELEKVGREVEREAVKAEKEIVKAEKEVREEVVKAEKAVRRRTRKAKPKKRET